MIFYLWGRCFDDLLPELCNVIYNGHISVYRTYVYDVCLFLHKMNGYVASFDDFSVDFTYDI